VTILVVGDANADVTGAVSHFPHEADDCQIADLGWSSGGSGVNTATALTLLDRPTQLLAAVGSDPTAEVAVRAARQAGVGCDYLQTDLVHATGVCFVIVSPSGERTFFSFRGANAHWQGTWPSLSTVTWLHVSVYALFEGMQRQTTQRLIAEAHQHHVPISLDLAVPFIRSYRHELLDLLPLSTVIFTNRQELSMFFPDETLKQAAQHVLQHQNQIMAVKRGKDGCLLIRHREVIDVPGVPVAAINTTGCGDAFAAGFIAAYTCNQSLEVCGQWANACGAVVAMQSRSTLQPDDISLVNAFFHQTKLRSMQDRDERID
jgi:sugar/nucleoside kinase (ribokinase family)